MAKDVTDEVRAQIAQGIYVPSGPKFPIPSEIPDCFGVLRDPKLPECQGCFEFGTYDLMLTKNQNLSLKE